MGASLLGQWLTLSFAQHGLLIQELGPTQGLPQVVALAAILVLPIPVCFLVQTSAFDRKVRTYQPPLINWTQSPQHYKHLNQGHLSLK